MTTSSALVPGTAGTDDSLLAALEATLARARGSLLYRDRLASTRLRSLDDVRALPFTTRADLQQAGVHGTRAVPLSAVCHYGESSGTSGATNSVWLTARDLAASADAIRGTHPGIFAPGRIILNRFPFMAAPAHLIQLIAQAGAGVAVPAGNINWDVPFPRALDLALATGAHVLASLPLEPVVLGAIARARGLDPARDLAVDSMFLGGAALPAVYQRRIARDWDASVVELYGSTETMLLGTSCAAGTLHLYDRLAYCEVLDARGEPVGPGGEGYLVVTTLAIEGSPLVRLDTGDVVRRAAAPCACGRGEGVTVLGRTIDRLELAGRALHPYDVVDAAAAAADALGSAIFFVVVLPDRMLVRVEPGAEAGDPVAAFRSRLPDVPVEVERAVAGELLDVEMLCRSPHVYKPVVLSDWRGSGRRLLSVVEGMIEWPRPSWAEGRRWLAGRIRAARRRRRLVRETRLAARAPR